MTAQPNVSKQQYQELAEQAGAQLGYTVDNFEFYDNTKSFDVWLDINGVPMQMPNVNYDQDQKMVYAIILHKLSNYYIVKNTKER